MSSIDFLRWLRPRGPYVLTAIVPDGKTETVTVSTGAVIQEFLERHEGKQNIYYSPNPTKGAVISKANKDKIACAEFVHADLDPRPDETPEEAKARWLAALTEFALKPSVIIDSGNGLQALWRLRSPCADKALVERINKALLRKLGSTGGEWNIDRILRLPGTTNLPNKKKLAVGRVPCPSSVVARDDANYSVEMFLSELDVSKANGKDGDPTVAMPRELPRVVDVADLKIGDELMRVIQEGCYERWSGDRSKAVHYVSCELARLQIEPAVVAAILLCRWLRISDHVYDQGNPRAYAMRQATRGAVLAKEFITDEHGGVRKDRQHNVRVAMIKLGVEVQYDEFSDRVMLTGLEGFGPVLEDAALDRIWLLMDERYKFKPTKEFMRTVILDDARRGSFHPVLDYLDGLKWDGVPRIDTWLPVYAGAEDTPYVRAVGALFLVAACRRVRQPGAKFDEMLVLESPEQGTDKSSALGTIAVKDDWFTDSLPLNADPKRVIEALRGKWIVEAPELSGMRRADVEHLKAMLSRRTDRARLSYDKLTSEVPRQFVIAGTTNSEEYLKDETGNRRFWPVRIGAFDVAALRRDVHQLWAEASERERAGASIRLDPSLWPAAGEEQQGRLTSDPYVDKLRDELGHIECGKIKSTGVWLILGSTSAERRTQDQNNRMGAAMRRIGWGRPNKSGTIKVGKEQASGYVVGEPPWPLVEVQLYKDENDPVPRLEITVGDVI